MKLSAVIKRPSVSSNPAKSSAMISASIIIVGITVGTALYVLSEKAIENQLWNYFISFSTDFANKNKPEIFFGLVMQNLAYFSVTLFCALCVFGTPAVFFLSFTKSLGLGMLTTYIYDSFALRGIEYCLLVFFPGKILLIFAMILLTQNCYVMSTDINRSIRNKSEGGVEFRKFTLRGLFILFLIILSSLIDFLTVISFSSLFDFS